MRELGTAPTPLQDPVAVAISQGKQNNTASASAACRHGPGTVHSSADVTCHALQCWVLSLPQGRYLT